MLQVRFLSPLLLFLFLTGFGFAVEQEEGQSLQTVQIKAKSSTIQAEVARTPAQREQGLMHRDKLADNSGMIFLFPGGIQANFWMKDTSIPLSIAFLDAHGVILEITDMQPFDQKTVRSQSDQVYFALEMNQHWFALNQVKAGDNLTLVGSSWAEFLKSKR